MKKATLFLLVLTLSSLCTYSQWFSGYNYEKSGEDAFEKSRGVAVTVDKNSNCYVLGYTGDDNNYTDILLLKYNPEGELLWSRIFNGTANKEDKGFGLVTDNEDNVLIAGYATMTGRGKEMLTVKYNSQGDLLWYKAFGITNDDLEDKAYGILVDDQDNAYITGYSTNSNGLKKLTVLKYSSDGTLKWDAEESKFTGFESFAIKSIIDNSDKLIVAGTLFTKGERKNIIVLKYNKNGNLHWDNVFNGSANMDDEAYSISTDKSNNIFVTGYETISDNNTDILYYKINAGGNLQWINRYDGGSNLIDKAFSIITDEEDNLIIIGHTTKISTLSDYLVMKFNGNGDIIWNFNYNGPVNGNDKAVDIVKGNGDRYFITGQSYGLDNNFDFATIELKANGIIVDVERFSLSNNSNDIPVDMTFRNNEIFITGYSTIGSDTTMQYSFTTTQMFIQEPISIKTEDRQRLLQNYPNPFNPSTTIRFSVIEKANVKIRIFNILGNEVTILLNSVVDKGNYEIEFNATNLPSGVYFYEMTTGSYREVRKMTLLR